MKLFPFQKNYVLHAAANYTAILKLIETQFDIPSLTKRDVAQMDMSLSSSTSRMCLGQPPRSRRHRRLEEFATTEPRISRTLNNYPIAAGLEVLRNSVNGSSVGPENSQVRIDGDVAHDVFSVEIRYYFNRRARLQPLIGID